MLGQLGAIQMQWEFQLISGRPIFGHIPISPSHY